MNIFKTIPVLALFLGAVSCTDFLKETSQDEIKPTSANDYKELITGEIYNETNNTAVNTYLDIMTDDCEEFARNAFLGGDTRNAGFGYFTWQQNPELQVEGVLNSDNAWAHYYHQILMTNMILYDIDNMNGTDQEKSLVKAEAHMIRAYAYYMLVNLYGEPYDPATASSALGVPINNLVGAQDVKFQRASVHDIYDIITDDCKAAINYFIAGGDNNSIYRWNLNAARVFYARVCLYLRDWETAIKNVNEVLAVKADLWNLNDKLSEGTETAELFFFNSRNPEILFTFGYYYINYFATGAKGAYPASTDLLKTYAAGDLRVDGEYGDASYDGAYIRLQGSSFLGGGTRNAQYKYDDASYTSVHGQAIRTAEAYLIRAEANVNIGAVEDALDDLNTLRSYRMIPGSYTELSGLSQEEALVEVKAERRRELCFEQLRWFDLRRWDRPSIIHTYTPDLDNLNAVQYYRLEENDPAYTLPVPREVLEQDSDLEDITRPVRNMISYNPGTGE